MNSKIQKELEQLEKEKKEIETHIATLKIERKNRIRRIKELKQQAK